jgi:hypothetical protein
LHDARLAEIKLLNSEKVQNESKLGGHTPDFPMQKLISILKTLKKVAADCILMCKKRKVVLNYFHHKK